MEKLFSQVVSIKLSSQWFFALLITVNQQSTNYTFKIKSGDTAGNNTRHPYNVNEHMQISKHSSKVNLRSFNLPAHTCIHVDRITYAHAVFSSKRELQAQIPFLDEDHDIIVQHNFQNYVLGILSKEQNLSGEEVTDDDDDNEEEDKEDDDENEEEEEEEEEIEGETEEGEEEAEVQGGRTGMEKEKEVEGKCEKEKHSKTPEGENSKNSTVETEKTEETTQKETIVQQEKESTDNHAVNNSSENADDQVTGGFVGRTKFSLFKRKALKGQKNVSSKKEDESGKPLQSEEEEKDNIGGEDSKDENQNNTLQNSRETVTNQDGRMKSSTCILL
ncbi:sodium/potassium/calcium exchanger 1-like [Pezoporus flaviventris]|uniref:sodium/potassium/calcium exchanger 1-like n=1 Tax=Pezoporus flaviventris TaxID=889875 RepID=UPI002AAF221F|nr:sodium/potassium/calcium exchanger 1-like [Pezoporus flaviventris]